MLVKALVVAGLAYCGLCAVLFLVQRKLIYFPQPRVPVAGATLLGLPIEAGQVLVTSLPRSGPGALLYFGGNAEDASHNLPGLSSALPDHAIYLMHYRGYGGSAGTPSEAALVTDAVALFDKVHVEHPRIVVVGRSLGSGVAVQLASLRPVARLVLVTPYDSLVDLAAQQFPYVPVRWLLHDKFESWRYAQQIRVPTLVIAAEHDEVIPSRSTQALHARFGASVAAFKVLPGTGHNTISEHPDYWPLIKGAP
jgi:uncharacterized protein